MALSYSVPVIRSVGGYLPPHEVSNEEMGAHFGVSAQYIQKATGVCSRRIALDEDASDMAVKASVKALEAAGMTTNDIDWLILSTSPQSVVVPHISSFVHEKLGLPVSAPAMDINGACTGFLYGLSLASALVRARQASRVLLVASEMYSRILDWSKKDMSIIFGDGAGACIICAEQDAACPVQEDSLVGRMGNFSLYSGGKAAHGTSTICANNGMLQMKGYSVYKCVPALMEQAIRDVLSKDGCTLDDVSLTIAHQCNSNMLRMTRKLLGLEETQMHVSIHQHANTASASIPLAYCDALSKGKIKAGDLVVLCAAGAGMSWGACTLRF